MSDLNVYDGEVVWFHAELNYGFLSWEKDGKKQEDMFCHYSDILMEGFKILKAEQKVKFEIGLNHSGQPKAINVKIIE